MSKSELPPRPEPRPEIDAERLIRRARRDDEAGSFLNKVIKELLMPYEARIQAVKKGRLRELQGIQKKQKPPEPKSV